MVQSIENGHRNSKIPESSQGIKLADVSRVLFASGKIDVFIDKRLTATDPVGQVTVRTWRDTRENPPMYAVVVEMPSAEQNSIEEVVRGEATNPDDALRGAISGRFGLIDALRTSVEEKIQSGEHSIPVSISEQETHVVREAPSWTDYIG